METLLTDLEPIRSLEERDSLILKNQGLIPFIIERATIRYPTLANTPLDELCAACQIPLIKAATFYEPERGYKFSSYACKCIWNYLARNFVSRKGLEFVASYPDYAIMYDPEYVPVDKQDLVRKAIGRLHRREREVLTRHYGIGCEEESFRSIANDFKCTFQNVQNIDSRARRKMRQVKALAEI